MITMSRLILRGARFPGDIAIEDGKITALGTIEVLSGDSVLDCEGDIVKYRISA